MSAEPLETEDDWRSRFEELKAAAEALKAAAREHDRRASPDFNIFRTLGMPARGAAMHASLLAMLWDEHGAHGQGDLFLRTFLRTAAHNAPSYLGQDFRSVPSTGWKVATSVPAGAVALDILLSHPGEGALVVVQNHVRVSAPPPGKCRDWLESQQPQWPLRRLLLLTASGNGPALPGSGTAHFTCHRDVSSMIARALPQVRSSILAATLEQYLQVIPTL